MWEGIALHNSKWHSSTINNNSHLEPVAILQCEIQCYFLKSTWMTSIDSIVLHHFSNNLSNISYQQIFKMQNKYMRDLPCLCISKEFLVHYMANQVISQIEWAFVSKAFMLFTLPISHKLWSKQYLRSLEVMTDSDLHEGNGEENISMFKTADKKEPSGFKSLNHCTSTILLQKNVNYLLGAPPPTPSYIGRNQLPIIASLKRLVSRST